MIIILELKTCYFSFVESRGDGVSKVDNGYYCKGCGKMGEIAAAGKFGTAECIISVSTYPTMAKYHA